MDTRRTGKETALSDEEGEMIEAAVIGVFLIIGSLALIILYNLWR